MEGKFELQFEDNEYYLVNGNTNDTVATTDKVLLKDDGYMKKLSFKNCQAIENGYDLDELAVLSTKEENTIVGNKKMAIGFIKGFNKAIELNDKMFTLDKFIDLYIEETGYGMDMWSKEENEVMTTIAKIVQSLQQTEWDVEIEMEDADGCLILRKA
jgi:hypothetical protein